MICRLAVAAGVLGVLSGCGEEAGPGSVSVSVEEPSSSAASLAPPAETDETAEPVQNPQPIVGYYLGDGPLGPVLFREDRERTEPDHGPAESVGMLSARPLDPDYRTYWPPGAFLGAGGDDALIDLTLAEAMPDRPASMSRREAELSIQQVVYTLQAYAGRSVPVRFLLGDEPVDQLLGVSVSEPVVAAPLLETLSTMSLITPAEGEKVSGSFRASGLNNGFESTAGWEIRKDGKVVKAGATIAANNGGEVLYPWDHRVHIENLPPGTYTFVASNDDATDDGIGAATDTRTIVVR